MENVEALPSSWREPGRRYFSAEEVERLLESSYKAFFPQCSARERAYFTGHRRRFAQSLTELPLASSPGQRILDIGGFGLTPYWLAHYYGYAVTVWNYDEQRHQEGIDKEMRRLRLDGGDVEYAFVNVNLEHPWPTAEQFPMVFFTETLEHLSDPFTAMKQVHQVVESGGTVFLTTPNGCSLYALAEFLRGLPPWVYRYFSTDVGLFRHQFEQTPQTLLELCSFAGFTVQSLATHFVYGTSSEQGYEALRELLGLDAKWLGEDMVAMLKKTHAPSQDRLPPCLYDADTFYAEQAHAFDQTYLKKIQEITDQQRQIKKMSSDIAALQSERALCEQYKKQWIETVMLLEEQCRGAQAAPKLMNALCGYGRSGTGITWKRRAWERCKQRIHRMPQLHAFLRRVKRKLLLWRSDARVLSCYERCKPYVLRIPVIATVARKLKRVVGKMLQS